MEPAMCHLESPPSASLGRSNVEGEAAASSPALLHAHATAPEICLTFSARSAVQRGGSGPHLAPHDLDVRVSGRPKLIVCGAISPPSGKHKKSRQGIDGFSMQSQFACNQRWCGGLPGSHHVRIGGSPACHCGCISIDAEGQADVVPGCP